MDCAGAALLLCGPVSRCHCQGKGGGQQDSKVSLSYARRRRPPVCVCVWGKDLTHLTRVRPRSRSSVGFLFGQLQRSLPPALSLDPYPPTAKHTHLPNHTHAYVLVYSYIATYVLTLPPFSLLKNSLTFFPSIRLSALSAPLSGALWCEQNCLVVLRCVAG